MKYRSQSISSSLLQDIYRGFLTPVMATVLGNSPQWNSTKSIVKLAGSMVTVYEQVSKLLKVGCTSYNISTD